MDQFPQMLYKAGGADQIHGGHFSTLTVNDKAELTAALSEGWCESTPEALEAQKAAQAAALTAGAGAATDDGEAKPTREELEQKATDLGIAFKPQTSDKKLAEQIAAKLAE